MRKSKTGNGRAWRRTKRGRSLRAVSMVAKTQRGFFAYIRAEQGPRLGGVVTVDGQQVPYGYHGSPDVRGLIETMVAAAYRQFASRPDKGPTKPERNTWAYPSPSLRIE